MRILINGLYLIPGKVGGSETYLRGLIEGLTEINQEDEYVLALGPEAAATLSPSDERWRIVIAPWPSELRPGRLLLEQVWLPRVATRLKVDLIHSAGYTSPLVAAATLVTTIHDMNYRRHPEDLSLAERLAYAALIPPAARRSRVVITDSSAAAGDLVRWTGIGPSNVRVVHLAPRAHWPGAPSEDEVRLASAGVAPPYLLAVSAAYPHKNLGRLLRAFPLASSNASLVIVGLSGRAEVAVESALRQRAKYVTRLGWVDDALLAALYRNALGLAFPSLYEGFGLPILEAMSFGTPVLTSNLGAMAEVAGEAAELVDPYSVEAIRRGLQRLAHDPLRRNELQRLGVRRAADFTWRRTAEATRAIYSEAAADTM
ncbi:MAG: glycosyltransferase family 4 protein [Chloroflexi bacterium]|nr:glycosyltransferase family 4 protein [Chloroflexota bacterium]